MSDQRQRLNICKATLQDWRRQFAHQLRAQGIAANSTERAVRGKNRTRLLDGIYQADRRSSIRMRQHVEQVASDLQRGGLPAEPGKTKLLHTRAIVTDGRRTVADALVAQGNLKLAEQVWKFISRMPLPLTDNERMAQAVIAQVAVRREREQPGVSR